MAEGAADRAVRVVVVDDISVVREGFALVHPEIEVVATYPTVEPLLAEHPAADVVVLDLDLSDAHAEHVRQGPVAIQAVVDAGYRVCLYTVERRRLVLAYCMRAGAHGIVHKSDNAAIVTATLRDIAAGRTVITRSLVGVAEILQRHGRIPELTDRQLAVLRARARGMRWAEVARSLYITESTAQEHMETVNRKFAEYLSTSSPGDLERELGVAPGDLLG